MVCVATIPLLSVTILEMVQVSLDPLPNTHTHTYVHAIHAPQNPHTPHTEHTSESV